MARPMDLEGGALFMKCGQHLLPSQGSRAAIQRTGTCGTSGGNRRAAVTCFTAATTDFGFNFNFNFSLSFGL